jgi:hypothetical protein
MPLQERPKRREFVTRPWERMPYGLLVPGVEAD